MRIRWTTTAADDLTRIVEYIRKDDPGAARRVAETIFRGIGTLRRFPNAGRIGVAEKTLASWSLLAGHTSLFTRFCKITYTYSVSATLRKTGHRS